jgi:hypothetical protein
VRYREYCCWLLLLLRIAFVVCCCWKERHCVCVCVMYINQYVVKFVCERAGDREREKQETSDSTQPTPHIRAVK